MSPVTSHRFHPSILRAYDIRGIVGETLRAADAYALGRSFATIALRQQPDHIPTLCVGRDGRLSSPELVAALIEGITDSGANACDIGMGPTPMLYFAVHHLNAAGGIMVTGSHNPPSHNGFKLMLGKASFFGDEITALGEQAAAGDWASGSGERSAKPVQSDYERALLSSIKFAQPLRLAFDAGNGAAGAVCESLVDQLRKQRFQCHTLFTEIDGSFPNHHPDPSVPENLHDLQHAVTANQLQLGLAFDGDGDRLGAVDDGGRIIAPDHLLMLLARSVLSDTPGATIIVDVKTSQSVCAEITRLGGTPLMWKTGHSHIKTKMKEVGAAFAGEASGHIFFKDRYYGFDDGLYAALRLIEYVSGLEQPLSAVIDRLPTALSTPELRIPCADERKFTVIDEVQARLNAAGDDYLAIDGVRLTRPYGWWLLRASNTQGALIARCEAADDPSLKRLIEELREQLAQSTITLEL